MGSSPSLASIVSILMPIAKRKTVKSCIGKLTFAAAAYFIWQERNSRLFKSLKRSIQEVVDCIMSAVRLKLLSCRFRKSKDAIMFARLWELPLSMLKSHMACHMNDLAPVVPYVVNGVQYRNGYYLADEIYPEWASFVKSFTVATDPKHTYFKQRHGKHAFYGMAGANNDINVLDNSPLFDDLSDDLTKFNIRQESARKDVERAFGVLQGRWGLIQQPTRAYEVN
ncbi:ALP1-like protein isoform X1 [Tanacetum coccineum]|uniref:ALP1-like protein isoform X1 n=1 Tax=Tanacetum coccineum TaxID=301880 RepID=A0ABQ4Z9V8_9ASTR